MSLKDIALPLIERGIRVVPAQPGDRASHLENWPDLATTDPAVIEQWDKKYPDWNLVCVSNLADVCIVDIDNLDAALKMGMPEVPATFTVKSPKGHHAYFLHTDESRKLGSRIARNGVGTVAEFKDNRKSCCAPGCTRADGGKYVVEDSSPLIPIPQEYLDWFRAVDPKAKPKAVRLVHDDFDFDDLMDFYGIEVHGGGPWYYPAYCPIKGDIHHNERGGPDLKATAFYFDGETLGWKDLAASCDGASIGCLPRVASGTCSFCLLPSCGVWTAFADKRLFVCEIEIFSDRIIRHSGDKTIGIGRSQVLSLTEGGHWTLFGRANGLVVRAKDSSIFIPAECDQYAEIKAKLGGWRPIAG